MLTSAMRIDTDGMNLQPIALTQVNGNPVEGRYNVMGWSPDGTKILYTLEILSSDIYIAHADGTAPMKLLNHEFQSGRSSLLIRGCVPS